MNKLVIMLSAMILLTGCIKIPDSEFEYVDTKKDSLNETKYFKCTEYIQSKDKIKIK